MKFFLILLILVSTSIWAQHTPDPGFYYLQRKDVDLKKFPTPPEDGSRTDRKDMAKVQKYQEHRTEEQCQRAITEAMCSAHTQFSGDYGPLSAEEAGLVQQLYYEVMIDTDQYVNELKPIWNRPRPFVRDPSIKLCSPTHISTSYPSGHSAIGRATALAIAEIFPHHRRALIRQSKSIAESRVIAGVHHPSDIKAGLKLGEKVFKALKRNKAFQERIESIRKSAKEMKPKAP